MFELKCEGVNMVMGDKFEELVTCIGRSDVILLWTFLLNT